MLLSLSSLGRLRTVDASLEKQAFLCATRLKRPPVSGVAEDDLSTSKATARAAPSPALVPNAHRTRAGISNAGASRAATLTGRLRELAD